MQEPMNVLQWVATQPLWSSRNEMDVVALTGAHFILHTSNSMDGTRLVAAQRIGGRRGAWKAFVDAAETNEVWNWLDSLTECPCYSYRAEVA